MQATQALPAMQVEPPETRYAGELRFRLYAFPSGALFTSLKSAGIRTGFGDEWLRIGGVKFSADGSASERTMRMSTPYVGTNDYGILTMTQQEIHDAVDDAHTHNFQIGIHANGDVTIDPAARRVFVRGEEVALTQREFDLLLFLARHPGQAFTRTQLMDAVWQYAFYSDTSTVTVHVRRLRAKIEADPAQPRHIQTVWGVGYRFQP